MAARIADHPPRRRRFWHFFRTMWQRAANKVPPEAAPLVIAHEPTNDGAVTTPASETRFIEKDGRQRLAYFAAERYMGQEVTIVDKEKPNITRRELFAYIPRLLSAGRGSEAPNPGALWREMLRTQPTIDNKVADDWAMLQTNKEVISPFQLDVAMARRAEFIRKEILRGTFNEGFAEGEMPLLYRTFDEYTAIDSKDPRFFDKYLESDEEV